MRGPQRENNIIIYTIQKELKYDENKCWWNDEEISLIMWVMSIES